ncbi:alkaline phosphatase family protein, partial [Streptomyces mutabilis]
MTRPEDQGTGGGTVRPTPLLVLDVVGLTPRLLDHMPRLKALARSGSRAPLGTVLPAVTCAAQS